MRWEQTFSGTAEEWEAEQERTVCRKQPSPRSTARCEMAKGHDSAGPFGGSAGRGEVPGILPRWAYPGRVLEVLASREGGSGEGIMKIAEKHGITRETIASVYAGILTAAEQDRLWIDLQREAPSEA